MRKVSDQVFISEVSGDHTNTCNPDSVDQFVLSRVRSGIYKKCADYTLKEVMVQMSIEPFVSVRAIMELLFKVILDRMHINRYMINTVRIRARQKKIELENSNIEIHPRHFDISFIENYKETTDNYTEGMFYLRSSLICC